MGLSLAERVAALPPDQLAEHLAELTDTEVASLVRDWRFWGRPEQFEPAGLAWEIWLVLAGRGFGKTKCGGEWIAEHARAMPRSRWAVVCPTSDDVTETAFHGESGLLTSVLAPSEVERVNTQKKIIRLRNGSIIRGFAAIEPERLRGPQFHGAWGDEPASWFVGGISYVEAAWDMLNFATRLPYTLTDGTQWRPRFCVTGTPKPIPFVRKLTRRAETDPRVVVTRGSTYDNIRNLAPSAVAALREKYEGTRLGRQELHAEVLDDVEGALWTLGNIEAHRIRLDEMPELIRTVVAVDPAVTATGDETGIVVAGRGADGHGYVLADASMRAHPDEWARRVVAVFDEYKADRVVVEVNHGRELLTQLLRTIRPNLPIREVEAKKGKRLRAEPVAAMYEQGKVHHVMRRDGNPLESLETQMTTWTQDDRDSPDRLDALVYALADLMQHSSATAYVTSLAPPCPVCGFPRVDGDAHACTAMSGADGYIQALGHH